jgi:hypothetical protein
MIPRLIPISPGEPASAPKQRKGGRPSQHKEPLASWFHNLPAREQVLPNAQLARSYLAEKNTRKANVDHIRTLIRDEKQKLNKNDG